MRRVLALAALVAAFVFLAPVIASAHSWYSDRRDPVTKKGCCGGTDCAQLVIEPGVFSAEPGGYRVRLTLEQARRINPVRREGIDILIPWERVQDSEDGNFHLCIPRWNGVVRDDFYCFFAPPNT